MYHLTSYGDMCSVTINKNGEFGSNNQKDEYKADKPGEMKTDKQVGGKRSSQRWRDRWRHGKVNENKRDTKDAERRSWHHKRHEGKNETVTAGETERGR